MEQPHIHHHAHGEASGGNFFSELLKVYTPRRQCMDFEPEVVWLHIISDSLIALAYFSIPVALVYFVHQRKDLVFNWMFLLFAAFILLCGATHAFGVWAIWNPVYRLDGLVKAATGLVSLTAAALLWKLIPAAMALPSPEQLRQVNRELERQMAEKEEAEAGMRKLQAELEERVSRRTDELTRTNDSLRKEIESRKRIEHERARLLRSERRVKKQLENASQVKDLFLASLSHELRTPLNAIYGWTKLLLRKPATQIEPEKIEQGLKVIERNSKLQSQLIADLLDISRIVSGNLRLNIREFSPLEVVNSAIETVTPAAVAKKITIEKELELSGVSIAADPDRLQQILWNLLVNAVKFSDEDSVVTVRAVIDEKKFTIEVSDTGQGIKPEFLDHIFERFSQADPAPTRAHGGLGLGLAIVRHLVELHGGTVEARSDGPGEGATFTVELPLMPHNVWDSNGGLNDTEAIAGENTQKPLSGASILVVDDDADSRELLTELLSESGAEVFTVDSAEGAIAFLESKEVSLVISDIGMPERDGYDLIGDIRALPGPKGMVKAIALTAFARLEDKKHALKAGYDRHIPKPIDPDSLIEAVRRLLTRP